MFFFYSKMARATLLACSMNQVKTLTIKTIAVKLYYTDVYSTTVAF